MALNIVSSALQSLTPEVIGRIGSILGLDRSMAQTAVGGAVPALLAAFAGAASRPEGADRLADAVSRQKLGIPDNLLSSAGGANQQAAIDSGSGLLTSLLGGGAVAGLASAIGRFAGLGEGQSRSLLGLLGPMVTGLLGEQQRKTGLDARGVVNLLASQKDQIAAALPSGLSSLLGSTGLMPGLGTGSANHGRPCRRGSERRW
jgi:hypothetical protein